MSVFEVSCFVYRVGMCLVCANGCIFFFKQKTAYDMRMRGWSSDVCTSDLKLRRRPMQEPRHQLARFQAQRLRRGGCDGLLRPRLVLQLAGLQMQALRREASRRPVRLRDPAAGRFRSEEHTSELQSLMRISYAVFCLKKKKKTPAMTLYT